MLPKWITKDKSKKKSQKQERRLAKKLKDGRVQAGSGSLWGAKGDVRTKIHLIELKRTDKLSISLKKEWLDKITKEALKDNRIPSLGIEIGSKRYIIVEECYLEDILL